MVFVIPLKNIPSFVFDSSLHIKQVITCDDRPENQAVIKGLRRPAKKQKLVLYHRFNSFHGYLYSYIIHHFLQGMMQAEKRTIWHKSSSYDSFLKKKEI